MKRLPTILSASLLICSVFTALADKIDDEVKGEMERRHIQGLALGVIHRGKQIKSAEYGLANIELNVKVDKETAFEVGAVTTQFTAAGILLLMQDGKLSLDDEISKYLRKTPATWNGITIRELLTQSSGIKSFISVSNGIGFDLSDHLTQAQFIAKVADWPLAYKVGTTNAYSATGFKLLEFVIENVSGTTYWDFLDSRIFQPLGMNQSGNRDPVKLIPHRAAGYELLKNKTVVNRTTALSDMGGAGAMITSVPDMFKWDDALNSERILTSASKQLMWTQADLRNGRTGLYGLGCRVDKSGVFRVTFYSGATAGFSGAYMRIPELGLGIIVFTNTGESGAGIAICRAISNSYLEGN
jgi:CubicO group peptidase (beta-lactamase class C family)